MFIKRGVVEEPKGFLGRSKLLIAATMLTGTIVGAGVLGIPYVVAKAGFLYGFILMVTMGVAFLFLNLFVGEIVLRTKEQHQLTGYAEKYLGPHGKKLMTLSMLISLYGALTAYLIGEGAALHSMFNFGSPLLYTLIFFVATFAIIYGGIKATGKSELILIVLLLIVVFGIGLFSFDKISLDKFTSFNPVYLFLPYGVILFAYLGAPAIPEMQEQLGKDKKLMKKAIIIGSIVPIIIYLIFTFVMVGVIGLENFEVLEPNQRIATIALSIYSYPLLGFFANILAVLAMFTSYLTIGTALMEMYHFDYHLPRKISLLLTFSIPLIIALFDFTTFLAVLGVTGAFAGGIEGSLIMVMYGKAKKLGDRKPEYSLGRHIVLRTVLVVMFVAGVVYQMWDYLF